tara:strand:- start:900 stop:1079 length:180 start_codon:yes stop_codon:yes gene_type:complete
MGSLLDQIKSTSKPKKGGKSGGAKSSRRPTKKSRTAKAKSRTTSRPRAADRGRSAKNVR